MARRIRDYSAHRIATLQAGKIPSPTPYYIRWGSAGTGNSGSTTTLHKTMPNDGFEYQLGEVRFQTTPLCRGYITVLKNDVELLTHYGDLAMYWQPRSINSWYFTYPDVITVTVRQEAGIRYAYSRFVSFYKG